LSLSDSERDASVWYPEEYVLAVPANLRRISLARESVDGESANETSEPALRVELTSVNPYDGVKAELVKVDGVNVDGS
jgi:hypothetical protein